MSRDINVPRRKVGLGLWKLLAPGLALLDRLLLGRWSAVDRNAATHRIPEQAGLVVTRRRHTLGGVEGVLWREERRIEGAGRGDEAVGEGIRRGVLELDVGSGRHGGVDGGCEGDGDDAGGSQLRSSPRYTLCRREMDYRLERKIGAVVSRSCTLPVGA